MTLREARTGFPDHNKNIAFSNLFTLRRRKKICLKGCWSNYIEHIIGQNCHPVETSQEMWFLYDAKFDLYHNVGYYHIETSPLICIANQSTGFYMEETSVMKDLKS